MSIAKNPAFQRWYSRMLRRRLVNLTAATIIMLPFVGYAQNESSIPVIGFFGMAGAGSHVANLNGLR